MGRTKLEEKIKAVNPGRNWQDHFVYKTQAMAEEKVREGTLTGNDVVNKLREIMHGFLFDGEDTGIMGLGRTKSREAEAVHRLLLIDRNEDEVFAVFFSCALLVLRHKEVFPFTPNEARSAIETGQPKKVFEFYRSLMPPGSTWKEAPDYIVRDLKRYASKAGRGKTRLPSFPEIVFLSFINAWLKDEKGRQSATLLKRLFRMTFRKKIHLADYKYLIALADQVLAARLAAKLPGEEGVTTPAG